MLGDAIFVVSIDRVRAVFILTVYRLSIVQKQHIVEQETMDEIEMMEQRPEMLVVDGDEAEMDRIWRDTQDQEAAPDAV